MNYYDLLLNSPHFGVFKQQNFYGKPWLLMHDIWELLSVSLKPILRQGLEKCTNMLTLILTMTITSLVGMESEKAETYLKHLEI